MIMIVVIVDVVNVIVVIVVIIVIVIVIVIIIIIIIIIYLIYHGNMIGIHGAKKGRIVQVLVQTSLGRANLSGQRPTTTTQTPTT